MEMNSEEHAPFAMKTLGYTFATALSLAKIAFSLRFG